MLNLRGDAKRFKDRRKTWKRSRKPGYLESFFLKFSGFRFQGMIESHPMSKKIFFSETRDENFPISCLLFSAHLLSTLPRFLSFGLACFPLKFSNFEWNADWMRRRRKTPSRDFLDKHWWRQMKKKKIFSFCRRISSFAFSSFLLLSSIFNPSLILYCSSIVVNSCSLSIYWRKVFLFFFRFPSSFFSSDLFLILSTSFSFWLFSRNRLQAIHPVNNLVPIFTSL